MKSPNSAGKLEFNGPEIKVGLNAAKAARKPVKDAGKDTSDGMEPAMPKDKKMIMSPFQKAKRLPKRK